MADQSKIEWTDATWNIITGCSVVSPGCAKCYAMRLAGTRLKDHPSRKGLTDDSKAGPVWNGQVRFNEKWLDQPIYWARPRKIFVCAHGDLFHESVPDEWIDQVFAVMALGPRHVFQVLTKRADRARKYIEVLSKAPDDRLHDAALQAGFSDEVCCSIANWINGWSRWQEAPDDGNPLNGTVPRWPLSNIWLGFSAEDQRRFDERWEPMRPLAEAGWLIWCSAEPLLGKIDAAAALEGGLRWMVVGGESGPNARPMHPDWARSLRDQCQAAGVPFHFKQWGEWVTEDQSPEDIVLPSVSTEPWSTHRQDPETWEDIWEGDLTNVYRVGKKAAGRLLDGRTWDEIPRATS